MTLVFSRVIFNIMVEQVFYKRCNNLPGNRMIPFNNPNTPSTAIPKMRNGIDNSQKNGYRTSARSAIGQQRIKRMIQIKNVSIY
jgi:hypothetical protein